MTADPTITSRLATLADTWRHGEWTQDPRLIADTITYIRNLENQNRHLTGVHAELVRAEQLLERYEQKAAISRAGA